MKLRSIFLLVISFILTSCDLRNSQYYPEVSVSIATFPPPTEEVLLDFALSPDGSKLAAFLNTGVFLYNTQTLEKTVFQEFNSNDYSGLLSGAIAFSPDGKNIAISGKFADEHINIWDWETGRFVALISALPNGHFVTEIEFSPTGDSVLVRSTYPVSMLRCEKSEDSLELLTVSHSTELSFTKSFEKYWCNYVPAQIYFTDNNEMYLMTKSLGLEYWIDIVDTSTGSTIQSTEYKYNEGEFFDVSPSGAIIAMTRDQNNQTVTDIIEVGTGEIIETVPYTAKFTRTEGTLLVRDSDGQWSIWENEKITCSFDGFSQHYPYWKFSRDGDYFAVTATDKAIQIWKILNCERVNVLSFDK